MTGNKRLSIWFLFTTVVSIFNICTIRIFATNWPLYVVTANAVISLFGLILHMHMNEILAKQLAKWNYTIQPRSEAEQETAKRLDKEEIMAEKTRVKRKYNKKSKESN